jgi:hypothetical protein
MSLIHQAMEDGLPLPLPAPPERMVSVPLSPMVPPDEAGGSLGDEGDEVEEDAFQAAVERFHMALIELIGGKEESLIKVQDELAAMRAEIFVAGEGQAGVRASYHNSSLSAAAM